MPPFGVAERGDFFYLPGLLFPFLTFLTSTVFLQNVKTSEVRLLNMSTAVPTRHARTPRRQHVRLYYVELLAWVVLFYKILM